MGKEICWGTAGPNMCLIILFFFVCTFWDSMVGDDGADFRSTGFSEI